MTHGWNFDLNVPSFYLFNNPSWSLTVEFFLYITFPILAWTIFKVCRKFWQLLFLMILSEISALAVPAWLLANPPANPTLSPLPLFWAARFPPTFLSAFILGAAAARLYALWSTKRPTRQENWIASILIIIVIGFTFWLMTSDSVLILDGDGQGEKAFIPYLYRTSSIYLPSFTVIIFCLARYRTFLSWLLSRRLMVLLGEASFSFYMLHFYLIVTNDEPLHTAKYYYSFAIFVVAYMLALGCYTYIETPARRLIRKLGKV